MMSYNVGVQCCRFCQELMTAQAANNHVCMGVMHQLNWYFHHVIPLICCPICGHRTEMFHCGTPSVDASVADKYMCYCPPKLRLFSIDEALADLVKVKLAFRRAFPEKHSGEQ